MRLVKLLILTVLASAALAVPALAQQWESYLSESFSGGEPLFPIGQHGEASYNVDSGGRYVINGMDSGQDSLSALTDQAYYYRLEADCQVLSSTAGELAFCGLIFHYGRRDGAAKPGYYVFYVYGDGFYGVKRITPEATDIIIPLTRTDTLNPGASNFLAIEALGTNFDLFINDEPVDSFSDVQLDGGGYGFYISKHTIGSFDNFQVLMEPKRPESRDPLPVESGPQADPDNYRPINIPKDPNRPLYPWEVGYDKDPKRKKRELDARRDEDTDIGSRDQSSRSNARPSQPRREDPPEFISDDDLPSGEELVDTRSVASSPPSLRPQRDTASGRLPKAEIAWEDPAPRPSESARPAESPRRSNEPDTGRPPRTQPAEEPLPADEPVLEEESPRSLRIEDEPVRDASRGLDLPDFSAEKFDEPAGQKPAEYHPDDSSDQPLDTSFAAPETASMPVDSADAEAAEDLLYRPAPGFEPAPEESQLEPDVLVTAPVEPERPLSPREGFNTTLKDPEPVERESEPVEGPNADELREERQSAAAVEAKAEVEAEMEEPAEPEAPEPRRRRSLDVGGIDSWDVPATPYVPKPRPKSERDEPEMPKADGPMEEAEPEERREEHSDETPAVELEQIDRNAATRLDDTAGGEPIVDEAIAEDTTRDDASADEGEDLYPGKPLFQQTAVRADDPQPQVEEPADEQLALEPVESRHEQPGSGIELPEPAISDETPADSTFDSGQPGILPTEMSDSALEPLAEPEQSALDESAPLAMDSANVVRIDDDFSDATLWPENSNASSSYFYQDEAYKIDNRNAQTMAISYQQETFADMDLALDANYLGGLDYVGFGLAARFIVQNGNISYYGLFVSHSGEFMLLKVMNGAETVLKDWTASPLLNVGGVNRLALRVTGDNIVALINGQQVASLQDDDIGSGGYALLSGPGTSARFDNLQLSGTRR